ncbi:MAG: ATP-dependent DNA helicase, partial [Leptospiraceae bacterium]|nr:ATP-dependent DNA helicase [Leptospiraceae bacterium]
MSLKKKIQEIYNSEKIKEVFPDYEKREEQIQLTLKILECLEKEKILLAEAGTGIGKSLAYLLASAVFIEHYNQRVLISTETIALQSQLTKKDIPILEKILDRKIKAEIALGASNYICKRKLSHVIAEGSFGTEMVDHLKEFYSWEKTTKTGIKSEYKGFATKEFWTKVTREADNCLAAKCPNFSNSYYFIEKRKWQEAEILIVNHHLLGVHLAGDSKVLPEFEYIIIDEAHNLPEILNKSFAISTSWTELEALLNSIYLNEKKPMLVGKTNSKKLANSLKELIERAVKSGIFLFNSLVSEVGLIYQPTRITKKLKLDEGGFENCLEELKEKLAELKLEILDDPDDLENKETHLEVDRILTKLETHKKVIEAFRKQSEQKQVYWIEPESSNTTRLYKMNLQPIESKEIFQEKFFSNLKSAIFTSATLCTQKNDFEYFKESLGTKKLETIFLESPFPYETNALLYLPKQNSLRDPNENPDGYLEDLVIVIPKLLELTEGNAFVLFTSNKLLKDVYASLVEQVPYPIFSQIE